MKAIIIQDADAMALLDQLKLQSLQTGRNWGYQLRQRVKGISDADWEAEVIKEAHRTFHHIVCRWLQEQGASVVR